MYLYHLIKPVKQAKSLLTYIHIPHTTCFQFDIHPHKTTFTIPISHIYSPTIFSRFSAADTVVPISVVPPQRSLLNNLTTAFPMHPLTPFQSLDNNHRSSPGGKKGPTTFRFFGLTDRPVKVHSSIVA